MINKFFNEKNIGRISLINMLIVILILTLSMIIFIVKQTNREFERERASLVKTFIEDKKTALKSEVERLFNFIDYNIKTTKEINQETIKRKVHEVSVLTEGYYKHLIAEHKQKSHTPMDDIINIFSLYKWSGEKGYIYVINSKGEVIYHPDYEYKTNLYDITTPFGDKPIQMEINTALNKGEGYVQNMMPEKPESGKFIKRTAYVKKLNIKDWYIASPCTEQDMKKLVQEKVKNRISTVSFGNDGHYFILNTNGKAIKTPGNAQFESQDVTRVTDSSGVFFYKKLMSYAMQKNDFFVFHKQKYEDWDKTEQVVSYCSLYEQWNWLMCGSLQMDDLTPLINAKNEKLKAKLEENKRYSFILFIISAAIASIISYLFSINVQKIFSRYKKDIESRNKELEELNIELTNQLYTDHLTGLPNRNKLVNDLNAVDNPVLILLNIDSFKKINEIYGFIIGDFVLIDVGERIMSHETDKELKCYKFHGNEYAVLLDSPMSATELNLFMKDLTDYLEFSVKYEELEIEIDITVTAGVSAEKGNIFEKAGMALRHADKKKLPYIIYDAEIDMVDEYENDIRWTKVVKRALSENNLIPYFQPIANSKTGKVEKFECLLRLHNNNEVITPFQFLDIIKKTKLYQHVTKRIITKSFETFASNDFVFSINLSIEDIMDESTSKFILDMLKSSGIASRVIFELLESEGIESFDEVNDFIKEIKKTGAMVAIDDFGSGYSNFVYLSKLEVDIIKIDGSLIKNIDSDRQAQIIVETIIKFANQLNIKTVAEFVHSETVKQKVIDMGIDYIQGYYVGKPIGDIKDYTI
jgi:diguanylate cyclase (GGDEF)-like protein